MSTRQARVLVSILILVFAVMIIAGSCATEKKITKKDYRFISGTWINEDYNSHAYPAKQVLHRDGTFDSYNRISDTGKKYIGHYKIVDKWTDSEGIIWYKMHIWWGTILEGHPASYELDKFSESGKVWEYRGDSFAFPTEIDKNHPKYHIYHRQ